MKNILCSEYQKEFIYHDLLSQSNGELGTRLFTLNNLLAKNNENKEKTAFTVRRKLLREKDQYPCYSAMFNYPAFIDEILSFAREMILWEIPVSSLPHATNREIELSKILSVILEEDLAEKEIVSTFFDNINKIDSYENVIIHPQFEANYFNYKLMEEILQKPNTTLVSYASDKTSYELKYALSTRLEIEAVAQDICKSNKPCNVILCNYEEQYPVLKQVFKRYHIPYYAYKENVDVQLPSVFVSLAKLAFYKDNDSFVEAVKYNAFNIKANGKVLSFFREHPDAFKDTIEPVSLPDFSHDERKINKIIEECNDYLDNIKESLTILFNTDTVLEAIQNAYTVMSSSTLLDNPVELETGIHIYSILSNTLDEIHHEEDFIFLLKKIASISVTADMNYSSFCTVTDLTHPVPSKEISYILGCSGRTYPGIPVKKGLFDEAYVAEISNYPSLTNRHHAYIKQLDWTLHSANQVIYSYATNDYQGREIQPAFEIKQLIPHESKWELVTPNNQNNDKHKLDPDTAKKLFLNKDYLITGSVSSIERYFNCPFSYFIASGLKVQNDAFKDNDNAYIGTVSHSVMENALKKYDKSYPKITDEEIENILKPYFDELDILHPVNSVIHHLTKERLLHSLRVSIDYLQDEENNTLFKPLEQEKRFESRIFNQIELRGIIDRVDEINHKYRIIDYKSSEHSLSETKIKAGLQLQLLTYLIVYASLSQKEISGAYYCNLQTSNSTIEASTGYTAKNGIEKVEMTEETYKGVMYDGKKLKGWAFDSTSDEYTDYEKYYNPAKKIFNFDAVKTGINEIYNYFANQLLDGHIELEPVKGACTFCKYKCICHFNKTEKEPTLVLDKDFTFENKKSKEDE